MMQIIAVEEGGIACDASCPYYEESGVVQCYGGKKKSNCRMIMSPWIVDCHVFNPKQLYKLRATPEQFKAMVQSQGLKAIHQRKLYPVEHKEIHPVGWCPKAKRINRRLEN